MEKMDDIPLQEVINGLMLDLSLATSLPLGGARNLHTSYIAAAAAAHAIGERTKTLTPKTLKTLDWIIIPLVEVRFKKKNEVPFFILKINIGSSD